MFKKHLNSLNLTRTHLIIFVLALIVVSGAGIIVADRSNVPTKPNTRTAPAANSSQKSFVAKVVISPATKAQGDILTIKEYGITIPLKSDLHNLSYVTQSNPQKTLLIINLEIDSYTNMANKCLGLRAGTSQSIASIVKTSGKYDAATNPNVRNLKQFDGFYIADIGASLPAKVACKDPSLQSQYDGLYAQLNSALNSSFASAKLSS